jgi:uncharacterized repeat protein (TIGR02543 family)
MLTFAIVSVNALVPSINAIEVKQPMLTEVTVKPADVQGKLNFTLAAVEHESYSVKVTNLYGKVLHDSKKPKGTKTFSVAELPPSTYTLTVSAVNGAKNNTVTGKVDVAIRQVNKNYAQKFGDLAGLNKSRKSSIRWMYRHDITNGSPAGSNNYKPKDKVNRGAMAEFMRKLVGFAKESEARLKISDIAKLNKNRQDSISWLAQEGITVLSTDKKYKPSNPVNRGAMAEFMYKLAGSPGALDSNTKSSKHHVDSKTVANEAKKFKNDKALAKLKSSNPNRYYDVLWLAKNKITLGSNAAGTMYSPQNVVNRGAMAEFMQKLYDSVMLPAATKANTDSFSYKYTPTTDEPVEPTPDEPEESVPDEPTPDEPDEPVIDEPNPSEPDPDEPVIDEPGPDNPDPDEPTNPDPDEPVIDEPTPDEPGTGEPTPSEPDPDEPSEPTPSEPDTEHSVTFVTDGRVIVDVQQVKDGDVAIEPSRPEKSTHTFLGWVIDMKFTDEMYDFATPVTENLTLYAHFRIIDTLISEIPLYGSAPFLGLAGTNRNTIAQIEFSDAAHDTCDAPYHKTTEPVHIGTQANDIEDDDVFACISPDSTKILIAQDRGVRPNPNSQYLFAELRRVPKIVGLKENTRNWESVYDMHSMFRFFGGGSTVTEVKLPEFPDGFGSEATEMNDMFGFFAASSFSESITMPKFPAGFGSKATDMASMFMCFASGSRTELPLSLELPDGFGASAKWLANMFWEFGEGSSASKIEIANFPNGFGAMATSMEGMFLSFAHGAKNVTAITLPTFPENFGSAAINFAGTFNDFAGSSSATEITLPAFPRGFGSSAKIMNAMFYDFANNTANGLTADIYWHDTIFNNPSESNMFRNVNWNGHKILVPSTNTDMFDFFNSLQYSEGHVGTFTA